MLRIIIGIVVGLLVGGLVIAGFEFVNTRIFPFPEGLDFSDKDGLKKFVDSLPIAAFLILLLGHAVGSLVSGFVARKISRHASIVAPLVMGLLFTAAYVGNLISIPHPVWYAIVGFIMYLPFTFLGHKLAAD